MTTILGINAYHGDASAALLVDGRLLAAVEEERFTRVKHDTSFPHNSIRFCLDQVGLRPSDIDHFALSRNPKANLGRRVAHALKDRAGRQVAARRAGNLRKILRAKQTLADGLGVPVGQLRAKAHFVEHHLAHIGSSFYVSPFERAAVLSIDGFGDMISAMWGLGEGGRVRILGEVAFPHSLGVYYTAVTQYLGFAKYGDEYKVMGLASYGEPTYLEEFRRIVRSSGLGYDLGLEYFRHHVDGAAMTWDGGSPELPPMWGPGMEDLLGPARSDPSTPLEDRHRNIAASLQRRLEEIVLGMLRDLHTKTGVETLCLAVFRTRTDDRDFLIKSNEPFKHANRSAHRRPVGRSRDSGGNRVRLRRAGRPALEGLLGRIRLAARCRPAVLAAMAAARRLDPLSGVRPRRRGLGGA
jgi:carbamoyltransferase